jgi:hypothetical protein
MRLHRERSIRAYRPSRVGLPGEDEFETLRLLRNEKIELYSARVRAGLAIFPEDGPPPVAAAMRRLQKGGHGP